MKSVHPVEVVEKEVVEKPYGYLSVRIPKQLRRDLDMIAEADRRTVSRVAVMLLEQGVEIFKANQQ